MSSIRIMTTSSASARGSSLCTTSTSAGATRRVRQRRCLRRTGGGRSSRRCGSWRFVTTSLRKARPGRALPHSPRTVARRSLRCVRSTSSDGGWAGRSASETRPFRQTRSGRVWRRPRALSALGETRDECAGALHLSNERARRRSRRLSGPAATLGTPDPVASGRPRVSARAGDARPSGHRLRPLCRLPRGTSVVFVGAHVARSSRVPHGVVRRRLADRATSSVVRVLRDTRG